MRRRGLTDGDLIRANGESANTAKWSDRMILNAIEALAGDYLPPTFVCDPDFRLIYSTPGASDYLRNQQGRFGNTLPELLVRSLETIVLVGLQRCDRDGGPDEPIVVGRVAVPIAELAGLAGLAELAELAELNVRELHTADEGVASDPGPRFRIVQIVIRKVKLSDEWSGGFCVTVTDRDAAATVTASEPNSIADVDRSAQTTLQQELQYNKQKLEENIQELEDSNQELLAINQEMSENNDELQDTNEDLHHVNDELSLLNAEHQNKIEQLIEVTDDMENLFRSSDVATLFLDAEGCIRRLTPKAGDIFALNRDDVGRPLENFRNPLRSETLYRDIETVLKSERSIEKEVVGVSGERFLLRVMPYRSAQAVSGTVLSLISLKRLEKARRELEEQEARFRGTFENAAVGIAHVGLDGQWLRVNQVLCDMLGYPKNELIARTFQSITHPDDLTHDLASFQKLTQGVIESYSIRKRYVKKNGDELPIDLSVSMQTHCDGPEPYCIAVIKDASERVRFQNQLERAVAQRDQFLAMLSHELRNPLGAISNAVKVLNRRSDESSRDVELFSLLDRQTSHMTRLVEDLLDMSRVTQDKVILQRQLVNLADIAEESVTALRSHFERRNQTIGFELEGKFFPVIGDRIRLLQVVENLITNSSRYTPEGGAIVVRLRIDEGSVILQVIDNGNGIAEDQLDIIFSMFARGGRPEETQGGLGIGLALVKMLIERQGGRVYVESDGINQGSTFTIELPIVAVPEGISSKEIAHAELEPQRPTAGYRIVVVDDDADARQTLQQLLSLDGHDVSSAPDGVTGVEMILAQQPDIALVDISMPGMSGFELAERVFADTSGRRAKLIAVTGHGRPKDIQKTKAAGFAGHLVKPVDTNELDRLIDSLLQPSGSREGRSGV